MRFIAKAKNPAGAYSAKTQSILLRLKRQLPYRNDTATKQSTLVDFERFGTSRRFHLRWRGLARKFAPTGFVNSLPIESHRAVELDVLAKHQTVSRSIALFLRRIQDATIAE